MKIIYLFLIFLIKYTNRNNYINLYFIRHAEGVHNKAAKEYGHQEYKNIKWFDAILTNKGINDSINIQDKIKEINPDIIYSSPFRRTIQTMYYSTKKLNNNISIILDDNLREKVNGHPCNYRHNKTEVIRFTSNLFKNRPYKLHYENVLDDDNKINNVIIRGTKWLQMILRTINIKNIIIYTHGGFIQYFLNSEILKKLNTNYKCSSYPDNLEICKIKYVL
jgi:broad specificity phosphatase PhoE